MHLRPVDSPRAWVVLGHGAGGGVESPDLAGTDWFTAPLPLLVDHIVDTHHSYMKRQLPVVEARLAKVLSAHGERHGAMQPSAYATVDPTGVACLGQRVTNRAMLEAAGIDRQDVYVTNVVKHFNWEPRGKWRIHKKPRPPHIAACRPWLDVELAIVKPLAVVCLGATAAQALLGATFRVTQHRGPLSRCSMPSDPTVRP